MDGNRADLFGGGGNGDELPPASTGKKKKPPGIGGKEAKPSGREVEKVKLPCAGAEVPIVEL